jgi:hypothetical protein
VNSLFIIDVHVDVATMPQSNPIQSNPIQSNPSNPIMLTTLQKVKILQNLLCFVAVNAVYSSGEQCNKEGKEKKVFAIFEAELSLFYEQRGRWEAMREFVPKEFPKDLIRQTTKANMITSEKIWERGMAMRRDMVNWIADYGKILNFTVLKPMVDENNPEPSKDQFDLELNEDSGGNADTELRKILQKVTSKYKNE